jgi:2-methylcitrate dehydratase PrpD
MAAETGATERLGNFVARCATGPIPREVLENAAIRLVDALGLALIARDEPTVAAMLSLVAPVREAPLVARVWMNGTPTLLSEAVTANALAVHAHFHDDSDLASWTHPGSLIVPVAVSTGEAIGASLERVLRGIVAGYGAIEWLGAKERVARGLIGRGIRTTPTLGTIAAAAAASAVLQLDRNAARNAIGIASGITGGVLEPVRGGSDEWRVQSAHAARGGLLAAQLAQRGVIGSPLGLEGPTGVARALAGLAAAPPEWGLDPRVEAIRDACAKPWATLGDNMAAAAAAKLLHDDGVDPSTIRNIAVTIWRHYTEYPGTSYRGPFERTAQALASTAFAAAAMLTYGELEYDIPFGHREDPKILRLVQLVAVAPHDDTPYDATIELGLADGTTRRRSATESPRTLLFHDVPTATDLLERRLGRIGAPPGAGHDLAAAAFQPADRDMLTMKDLLDRLLHAVDSGR